MAKNIQTIASLMGADIVDRLALSGHGAFGAARLARILQQRLEPSIGRRPGRPTNVVWVKRPKIPMSLATADKLSKLAEKLSQKGGRRISPMQLAAQLLEEAVNVASG